MHEDIAKRAYDSTVRHGGITVNLQGVEPTEGYAYSPFPELGKVIPTNMFKPEHVQQYIDDNTLALTMPGNHLGTWDDTQSGNVFLDVSQVGPAHPDTVAAAKKANQIAVMDLSNFNEIPTGVTLDRKITSAADSQSVLNANAGRNLHGLPGPVNVPSYGPLQFQSHGDIQRLAHEYNAANGLGAHPTEYTRVNPETSKRIADEYERMPHNPHDPDVAHAYDSLARETRAQYDHAVDNGYKFEFYPKHDPYPNSPREAVLDLHHNKHMYVYPTESGYGSEGQDAPDHPLLGDSGVKWGGQPVTHNDLFRAVHDFYGHAKEGLGFRADGEDNAWRQHAAMFSEPARRALTAETRGQNSWVNYGPHGAHNQMATTDTVYAPQKAGLMPDWTMDPNLHRTSAWHFATLQINEIPSTKDNSKLNGGWGWAQQRKPFIYQPETGTIHVGEQGSHHGDMAEHLGVKWNHGYQGWINTRTDMSGPEQNSGQDHSTLNEPFVGWYGTPEPHHGEAVEKALTNRWPSVAAQFKGAEPTPTKWEGFFGSTKAGILPANPSVLYHGVSNPLGIEPDELHRQVMEKGIVGSNAWHPRTTTYLTSKQELAHEYAGKNGLVYGVNWRDLREPIIEGDEWHTYPDRVDEFQFGTPYSDAELRMLRSPQGRNRTLHGPAASVAYRDHIAPDLLRRMGASSMNGPGHTWEPGAHGKGYLDGDNGVHTWPTHSWSYSDNPGETEYYGPHHADIASEYGLDEDPERDSEGVGAHWHTPFYIQPNGDAYLAGHWDDRSGHPDRLEAIRHVGLNPSEPADSWQDMFRDAANDWPVTNVHSSRPRSMRTEDRPFLYTHDHTYLGDPGTEHYDVAEGLGLDLSAYQGEGYDPNATTDLHSYRPGIFNPTLGTVMSYPKTHPHQPSDDTIPHRHLEQHTGELLRHEPEEKSWNDVFSSNEHDTESSSHIYTRGPKRHNMTSERTGEWQLPEGHGVLGPVHPEEFALNDPGQQKTMGECPNCHVHTTFPLGGCPHCGWSPHNAAMIWRNPQPQQRQVPQPQPVQPAPDPASLRGQEMHQETPQEAAARMHDLARRLELSGEAHSAELARTMAYGYERGITPVRPTPRVRPESAFYDQEQCPKCQQEHPINEPCPVPTKRFLNVGWPQPFHRPPANPQELGSHHWLDRGLGNPWESAIKLPPFVIPTVTETKIKKPKTASAYVPVLYRNGQTLIGKPGQYHNDVYIDNRLSYKHDKGFKHGLVSPDHTISWTGGLLLGGEEKLMNEAVGNAMGHPVKSTRDTWPSLFAKTADMVQGDEEDVTDVIGQELYDQWQFSDDALTHSWTADEVIQWANDREEDGSLKDPSLIGSLPPVAHLGGGTGWDSLTPVGEDDSARTHTKSGQGSDLPQHVSWWSMPDTLALTPLTPANSPLPTNDSRTTYSEYMSPLEELRRSITVSRPSFKALLSCRSIREPHDSVGDHREVLSTIPWQVIPAQTRPEDSEYAVDGVADMGYNHHPVVVDPEKRHIYIGQPGVHHVDLHEEFDLESQYGDHSHGTVYPDKGSLKYEGADHPGMREALSNHLGQPVGLENADWEDMFHGSSDDRGPSMGPVKVVEVPGGHVTQDDDHPLVYLPSNSTVYRGGRGTDHWQLVKSHPDLMASHDALLPANEYYEHPMNLGNQEVVHGRQNSKGEVYWFDGQHYNRPTKALRGTDGPADSWDSVFADREGSYKDARPRVWECWTCGGDGVYKGIVCPTCKGRVSAAEPELVEGEYGPQQSLFPEDTMNFAPSRVGVRPVVFHHPTNTIYVGRENTHHADVLNEHGLDDAYDIDGSPIPAAEDSPFDWTSQELGLPHMKQFSYATIEKGRNPDGNRLTTWGQFPAHAKNKLWKHGLIDDMAKEPQTWENTFSKVAIEIPGEKPTVMDWRHLEDKSGWGTNHHGTWDFPWFHNKAENKVHLGPMDWFHDDFRDHLVDHGIDPYEGKGWGFGRTKAYAVKDMHIHRALEDHGIPMPETRWDQFFGKKADYYHQAPTSERARIQQHGLIPGKPLHSERWTPKEIPTRSLKGQPEGVYVTDHEYGFPMDGKYDTWRIPGEAVENVVKDKRAQDSWVIPHHVVPELHEKFEDTAHAEGDEARGYFDQERLPPDSDADIENWQMRFEWAQNHKRRGVPINMDEYQKQLGVGFPTHVMGSLNKQANWEVDANPGAFGTPGNRPLHPFNHEITSWTPGNQGKGAVSPEGRAFAWETTDEHDGRPSHGEALSHMGFQEGEDANTNAAIVKNWSFYNISHGGQATRLVGPNEHEAIMKAHLPQEPHCEGCGKRCFPDETGLYNCSQCHYTGQHEDEPDSWGSMFAAVDHGPTFQWYDQGELDPHKGKDYQGDHSFHYHPASDTIHIGTEPMQHGDILDKLQERGIKGDLHPGWVYDQAFGSKMAPEQHNRLYDVFNRMHMKTFGDQLANQKGEQWFDQFSKVADSGSWDEQDMTDEQYDQMQQEEYDIRDPYAKFDHSAPIRKLHFAPQKLHREPDSDSPSAMKEFKDYEEPDAPVVFDGERFYQGPANAYHWEMIQHDPDLKKHFDMEHFMRKNPLNAANPEARKGMAYGRFNPATESVSWYHRGRFHPEKFDKLVDETYGHPYDDSEDMGMPGKQEQWQNLFSKVRNAGLRKEDIWDKV